MQVTAKRADWTYRIAMAAMTAVIAWSVNWIGDKIESLSGLPGQVRQLVSDQSALKVSVDKIEKAQAGFATGEQVGTLRGEVDSLTGRVDTLTGRVDSLQGSVNTMIDHQMRPK
jgi:hypothetical protein